MNHKLRVLINTLLAVTLALDETSTEATLTGATDDGTRIEGTDSINILT